VFLGIPGDGAFMIEREKGEIHSRERIRSVKFSFYSSTTYLFHLRKTHQSQFFYIIDRTMDSWKSKLGNSYPRKEIERNEKASKAFLDNLRKLPFNKICADCGMEPTVWASVNLGVFLCLRCGSIHRGIGTHVSIPKGCTGKLMQYCILLNYFSKKNVLLTSIFSILDTVGTYLWGPDELKNMESMGNDKAESIYGGREDRPSATASDDTWKQFIVDKYEKRKFSKRPEIPVADILNLDGMTFSSDKTRYNESSFTDYSNLSSNLEIEKTNRTDWGEDFFSQYGI
jgi:hypothetical protein